MTISDKECGFVDKNVELIIIFLSCKDCLRKGGNSDQGIPDGAGDRWKDIRDGSDLYYWRGAFFFRLQGGGLCRVVFYRKGAGSPKGRIRFPANARTGDVWSMTVLGDFSGLEYVYEVDGQQVPDPYGRRFTGMERWGSPGASGQAGTHTGGYRGERVRLGGGRPSLHPL